jgi:hypothetical protein
LDGLHRPQGTNALLTRDLIGTGSPANRRIIPPGWSGDGTANNEARGHLLGAQLGGSGNIPQNLVTIQQSPANSPLMRDYEAQVRAVVESGQTVRYSATPVYRGNNPAPAAITLRARGSGGYTLNVTILNPVRNSGNPGR